MASRGSRPVLTTALPYLPLFQVQQMASCGFSEWHRLDKGHALGNETREVPHTAVARRLLGGGRFATPAAAGCGKATATASGACAAVTQDGVSTCAAGFFAGMGSKEVQAGWCLAAEQGRYWPI